MKTRHKTIQIRVAVIVAEMAVETTQTQMVETTQTTMRLPILTTTIQIEI